MRRHVHARSVLNLLRAAACGLAAAACGPGVDGDGSASGTVGGTMSDDTTGTAATGTASSTTVGSGDTTTDGVDTGAACPSGDDDDGGVKLDIGAFIECSSFEQDCREGFKCVPDGYSTRHCVPIDADPLPDGVGCVPGDADPCGPLSWCGLPDPTSGDPVCTPLCVGSPTEPECAEGTVCIIDDEDIVAVCQRPCDPFADACSDFTCQPTSQGFGCIPSGSAGASDRCFEDDSCAAGLVCDAAAPECCGTRCCTALCDPQHPCAEGTCVAYDPPIPGRDGVGRCRVPPE